MRCSIVALASAACRSKRNWDTFSIESRTTVNSVRDAATPIATTSEGSARAECTRRVPVLLPAGAVLSVWGGNDSTLADPGAVIDLGRANLFIVPVTVYCNIE